MKDLERNLVVVLGCFLAVLLFLYIGLKICRMLTKRKSRNYQHVLGEGQGVTQTSGDYVLVTAPPIKAHLFARGHRYKTRDYDDAECDGQNISEEPKEGKQRGETSEEIKTDIPMAVI